jgi:hypothetical protein
MYISSMIYASWKHGILAGMTYSHEIEAWVMNLHGQKVPANHKNE